MSTILCFPDELKLKGGEKGAKGGTGGGAPKEVRLETKEKCFPREATQGLCVLGGWEGHGHGVTI